MAHYARVNSDNIVTYVTPVLNSLITDESGVEHEEWGVKILHETIPDSVGDRWIQTSYNNNFRKRYASIGGTWNEELNAFIPPKAYESWTFDSEELLWAPPVPFPPVEEGVRGYYWDEDVKNWIPEYNV